jgi:hypothetical protein
MDTRYGLLAAVVVGVGTPLVSGIVLTHSVADWPELPNYECRMANRITGSGQYFRTSCSILRLNTKPVKGKKGKNYFYSQFILGLRCFHNVIDSPEQRTC